MAKQHLGWWTGLLREACRSCFVAVSSASSSADGWLPSRICDGAGTEGLTVALDGFSELYRCLAITALIPFVIRWRDVRCKSRSSRWRMMSAVYGLGYHNGQALVEAIISKYVGVLCARAQVNFLREIKCATLGSEKTMSVQSNWKCATLGGTKHILMGRPVCFCPPT